MSESTHNKEGIASENATDTAASEAQGERIHFGYVPRGAGEASGVPFVGIRSWCGAVSSVEDRDVCFAVHWDGVTCPDCLAQRPRENPPLIPQPYRGALFAPGDEPAYPVELGLTHYAGMTIWDQVAMRFFIELLTSRGLWIRDDPMHRLEIDRYPTVAGTLSNACFLADNFIAERKKRHDKL